MSRAYHEAAADHHDLLRGLHEDLAKYHRGLMSKATADDHHHNIAATHEALAKAHAEYADVHRHEAGRPARKAVGTGELIKTLTGVG